MNEYFHEIFKKYGTEFWSNNPSGRDMKVALKRPLNLFLPIYKKIILKNKTA